MEYYSAIKKNEILPFPSIMLSETSQRKTSTVSFHSYMEFKKQNKWSNGGKKERKREANQKKTLNYREQIDGDQRGGGVIGTGEVSDGDEGVRL